MYILIILDRGGISPPYIIHPKDLAIMKDMKGRTIRIKGNKETEGIIEQKRN